MDSEMESFTYNERPPGLEVYDNGHQRLGRSSERLQTEKEEKGMISKYIHTATIHGLSHTTGPEKYKFQRPLWVLMVILMAMSLSWTLVVQISHFLEYPIKSFTKITLKGELVFPAVTVCNLNQYLRNRIPDIPVVKEVLLYESEYSGMTNRRNPYANNMSSLDNFTDVPGDELGRLLRNAAPRVQEFLIDCMLGLERRNCTDLFEPIETAYGTCYVFNGPTVPPDQRVGASGVWSMLRFMVDIKQNNSFFSRLIHAGIKIIVHEPDEVPFPVYQGWFIRPGVTAAIALRKSISKGLPRPFKAFNNGYCEDIKAKKYVNKLKRYKIYTSENCNSECFYDNLEAACGCQKHTTPGTARLCSAKEMLTCLIPQFGNHQKKIGRKCHCPKECEYTAYTADVSYAKFASNFIEEQAERDKVTLFRNQLSDDIIDVRVFFKTLNVEEAIQEPEITMQAVLGSIGGQMGLFLGASVLSVTELVEVVLLLAIKAVKQLMKMNI